MYLCDLLMPKYILVYNSFRNWKGMMELFQHLESRKAISWKNHKWVKIWTSTQGYVSPLTISEFSCHFCLAGFCDTPNPSRVAVRHQEMDRRTTDLSVKLSARLLHLVIFPHHQSSLTIQLRLADGIYTWRSFGPKRFFSSA